ncbi:MAG: glycosyltransferase 87 family protein [Thermoleophilaceae bacterium]
MLCAAALSFAGPAHAQVRSGAAVPGGGGQLIDRNLAIIGIRAPAQQLRRVRSLTPRPPGFQLTGAEAVRIARAAAASKGVRGGRARVWTRGDGSWRVSLYKGGAEKAQVYVSDADARATEIWTGRQVDTYLARGYSGQFVGKLNAPWLWLPLCLLFVLPFIDPRRPFRLLHLDLLVLVAGLGLSHFFFERGNLDASVPLVYPVLGYVLARMLYAGFRPRERAEPLVPWARPGWLLAGIALLVVFRIVLSIADPHVIDVGYAGVIGADRLTHGHELYAGGFPQVRGDTYGPFDYIAYVPFELVFPWHGVWDSLPAARAAAIAFDLLTMVALFFVGRRLRPGREGRLLGVVLAYAWAAFPYAVYTTQSAANDALVSLCVTAALAAFALPWLRGAFIGLGAAAKFAPLALAPLFATGRESLGTRNVRQALVVVAALAMVLLVTFVPLIPPGGVHDLYDRTVGYQASRSSPFSIWGLAPGLHPLRPLVEAAAALLALGVAVVPRRRSLVQVAALGAAVLVAVQLPAKHWFYIYVVWFAPLMFAALFAEHTRLFGRERRTA